MKFMETADEEVTDETIKIARIVGEQCGESVTEACAGFIGEKGQVGRYLWGGYSLAS